MAEFPITIFVCGRPGTRCACYDWAVTRCAYPLRGPKEGKTCDVALCARCQQGGMCGPHRRVTDAVARKAVP